MGKSHYLHIFWLVVWTPLKNMKVKWDYLLLPIYGKSSKSWFQTTNQNPISIHNYGKIHHFQWVNPTICIYSGWWFWTPLKNMKVKWDYCSQYMESHKSQGSKPPTRIPFPFITMKIHDFQWVNPTICIYSGWWFEPHWKIWKSNGIIAPNIWKVIKVMVPNHQPESHFHS